MRKPRYIRMVIIAQTVSDTTSEAVKGVCENLAYLAEDVDTRIVCAEAHEIGAEIGEQYFSMWRS
jgi:hypothetical protein